MTRKMTLLFQGWSFGVSKEGMGDEIGMLCNISRGGRGERERELYPGTCMSILPGANWHLSCLDASFTQMKTCPSLLPE